jgi:limonene-1,2-epoxide hydrolase
MSDREEGIVRDFLDALTGDAAGSASYFADGGSWRLNAWHEPVIGVQAIRADLERVEANWSGFRYDLLNVASAGTVVFVERIDRGHSQGKDMAVHVVGVFDVDEGGKITSWRDYYDAGEVEGQRAG